MGIAHKSPVGTYALGSSPAGLNADLVTPTTRADVPHAGSRTIRGREPGFSYLTDPPESLSLILI